MAETTASDYYDQQAREPKPFEGYFVEIHDLTGGLAPRVTHEGEIDIDADEVDVEGQCGRCLSWIESAELYIVDTFQGMLVAVPENCLREWLPPPPDQGGFDLMWPTDSDYLHEFGSLICGELANKGYCVVQMSLSQRDRSLAAEDAEGDGERPFSRLHQEIEAGYMGFDNNTKVATLPPGEEDALDEPENRLDGCSRQVNTAAYAMAPFTSELLGFNCVAMQNTMIRMSIDKMDEDELFPEALVDLADEDDAWTAHVQQYVRFAQTRKVSILYMIDNEGGDMWLYPRSKTGTTSVKVPIMPNRLVIFRHDMMDYSYQVQGPSVALQTWMLDEFHRSQEFKEISMSLSVPGKAGLVMINPGPNVPEGPCASVMALDTRMPGDVWNRNQYWLMFGSGTDAITKWPAARWDCDPYYEEGADSLATGKSYTCHGGFVTTEQITQFDNEFFKIDYDEARSMIPGQKMCLEVGYSCLVQAGFTQRTLRGRRLGVWYGDVGPDWGSFQSDWARFCSDISPNTLSTSMSNAGTATRLSHIFDLKGPISSYDTACSASLVAMNAAHLMMFDGDDTRMENSEALVTGINTLLGPGSFIGNCQATMLSHVGRCFTFNRAADGYQRGEGCGSIFFKAFKGDRAEEENRVCALIGTATNQDGRSASLTAPNGPAQQAVIRKSMAFAHINPNTVSIAECHGTGTALGDPIEVGALMAVMHQRKFPICKTSAKSNIAHLEAGAGIAGLTKCIMMINVAAGPPNCHFNVINAHLTIEGYPVIFDTEAINTDYSSSYCGVSSFGFGGTNSRADVYGYAKRGHRAAIRVELPKLSPPRVIPIGQPVFILGTWDNWSSYEKMEGGRFGKYTCSVVLGDTRQERFQLSCDLEGVETIHPLISEAGQSCQVVGPDREGRGLHFCINGLSDGARPGTIYEIELEWTEEKKTVSWKPTSGHISTSEVQAIGDGYDHHYYLVGSWRQWVGFQELRPMGNGLFQGSFKMGPRQVESFQIVRNKDFSQVFHPATSSTATTGSSVPFCGPDCHSRSVDGARKAWNVRGPQHEEMLVTIQLVDSDFRVSVAPADPHAPGPELTWESWLRWLPEKSRAFYIQGTFTDESLAMMSSSQPEVGVHRYEATLDAAGFASFLIAASSDRSIILGLDGQGNLQLGEERDGLDAWYIYGTPNSTYEVVLDTTQLDPNRMVTWTPLRALAY